MAKTQTKSPVARIEVFRPGTFTPMEGASLAYTAADLKAVADAYDFDTAPAPIVVGHPATDAPAYGWVMNFDFDATTERLYANIVEIDTAFSDAVKEGRYKKVSFSMFRPDHPSNPTPGTWYPKHVGFLGGAAPAVSGLKNVQFSISNAEAATFTASFGEWGFERSSRIFQGLREFFIEKFGMEDADRALPAFEIEWLGDIEIEEKDRSFTAPVIPHYPESKQEAKLSKEPDVSFAEREADLTARDAKLKEREAKLVHDDNVSFASGLVDDGRLLPVSQAKVVALLDALPADETVSFAEGGAKIPFADAVREILKDQPTIVSFGRADLPEAGSAAQVAFASDGKAVDPAQLEIHSKAIAYQNQHPGTEYMTAVKAVS